MLLIKNVSGEFAPTLGTMSLLHPVNPLANTSKQFNKDKSSRPSHPWRSATANVGL
jgi:hypothetical protein